LPSGSSNVAIHVSGNPSLSMEYSSATTIAPAALKRS
jgi:hypothetical protein